MGNNLWLMLELILHTQVINNIDDAYDTLNDFIYNRVMSMTLKERNEAFTRIWRILGRISYSLEKEEELVNSRY